MRTADFVSVTLLIKCCVAALTALMLLSVPQAEIVDADDNRSIGTLFNTFVEKVKELVHQGNV